ncbi:glycosyltransferase family 2 protein [Synechococcus sp. Cruz-9H2]|uniref:glycosyltransferase n=1 Tax=unclassified Synechococcus TaxID=2626047 RepID=UPI0020CB9FF9|nr:MULTISPECIES: glycosyltransferase family 2 protein [unclassified Synechococcus]MCP9818840.1 glycosyltransferase family 2 protein [Synechococcus sp. Cruz-9H2]MCP9843343.1 glycosyltransferase family 2 protein [Synechococcus sp. Edmonson 11F2]MCP9855274.1 glycosyltransferase family 2 protein [Synechococcus sp. Cruz-9C9]MCP9862753.1 glycosyltransferase family 2 protein [Synechococcus sp. Cruz-7E5]MCP9869750.1 glycosyltransferase family 2 protein [Synechococcus sp. Cruz-7B9]
MTSHSLPRVSVIIEGYNESRGLGTAEATLEALTRQDMPLGAVEVILVGRSACTQPWQQRAADPRPFQRIQLIDDGDTLAYLEIKNEGARHASGPIVVCTDSDVLPATTWLRSIVETIEAGADVSVGPSLFQGHSFRGPLGAMRLAAASITWGWIVGPLGADGRPTPRGFMDHNVGLRAEVFADHRYCTEYGRILGAPLLFRALSASGARIKFHPDQQAAHHFSWHYWLVSLHFRYGYEVMTLRRIDPHYPNQWIRHTGPLEPIVSMGWHVALDLPRWFRFSRLVGVPMKRRLRLFPLLLSLSLLARASEMVGGYATLISPAAMRRWAEAV